MAATVVGTVADSYATKEEPLTTYSGRASVLDTGFGEEDAQYCGLGGLVYDGEPFMLGPDEGAWVPVRQVLSPPGCPRSVADPVAGAMREDEEVKAIFVHRDNRSVLYGPVPDHLDHLVVNYLL